MIDVRKVNPEQMVELLSDKRTWKICESVHLGLPCIYLTFVTLNGAGEEYSEGHELGIYKSFEKIGTYTYKFALYPEVVTDYMDNVLPNLPKGWYAVKQPWMDM